MSRLFQWLLLALSITPLAIATPLSTYSVVQPDSSSPLTLAPLEVSPHPHGTVNNSYIVILKDNLPVSLMQNHINFLMAAHNADPLVGDDMAGITQIYEGHTNGYAGRFTTNVLDQIRRMPEVAYVEKDQIVRTQDIQRSAPWGLARISHRPKLTLSNFNKYVYDKAGGEGVDVYVIDTGISIYHEEFEGRASWGKTMPQNDVDEDGNGHGTHCAGTIASRKFGVAKKANVIAVKVLGSNGSGTMSDVVGGVVWVSSQAKAKAEAEPTKHKGSVANMSLGGGSSRALDEAVNRAVEQGVHFAVAAGNDNRDACNSSPAAAEKAVTVGASTLGDERAYFSNHGRCVDVFAPGLNIISTYKGGPNATATLSGTSMASPHTAGLLAYLVSIYPSKDYDPSFDSMGKVVSLHSEHISSGAPSASSSSLYAMAHHALPLFISSYLPSPNFLDIVLKNTVLAPIPPKRLSTAEMKQGLLALTTSDVISDLPPNTVNKLIYNNCTA